ncbi:MAG: hypothetical protein JNM72_09465 [Deltaproteobacteria bacterium]|jgi:hypothetical protein|nr:hypothetical protein [Deltaproteobacteria bacterium]
MRKFIWVVALAAACSGGDKGGSSDTGSGSGDGGGGESSGDGGSDGGGDGTGDQADYINTAVTPVGDFTGFEAGYGGAWLNTDPTVAPTEFTLQAQVLDFQEDTPVADATVDFYLTDAVTAVPELSGVTDPGGNVAFAVPTCTPLTYKTSTDAALEETVPTFEAHQVYGVGTSSDTLNSVSTTTYNLIPSLLGVSVQDGKATAAGTAYDMNDDPITGAQVVVKSLVDDSIPDGVVVKYFVDSFPNRSQPETSPDGLWVAINIPAGEWKVEMWVSDGAGGHLLMGQSKLTVFGNSINISNIYTGFDSVKYPSSCFASR